MNPTKYYRLSALLFPDNRLVLRRSYLIERTSGAVDVKVSPLKIEFYQGNRLLLRWGLALIPPPLQLRGPMMEFGVKVVRGNVPFPPETDRLVFLHNDVQIYEFKVPEKAPSFDEKVRVERSRKKSYRLLWKAKHPQGLRLSYSVRASADGGKTWKRLASNLIKPGIELPRAALVGGKNCIVEVLAYDGVNVVPSRVHILDTPPVRLDVIIVSPNPERGSVVPPVILRALGSVRGISGFIDPKTKFVWTANGKKIAEGKNAIWRCTKAGDYKISVQARLGKLEAKDSVSIKIGDVKTIKGEPVLVTRR